MIIPDLNPLIYAYDATSPYHARASKWWVSCLSGATPIGIAWLIALGFVCLWTSRKVFEKPMAIDTAAAHVESWLARRAVQVVHPGPRHAEALFGLLRQIGKGGNLTTDAHLAALAVEHKAVIHTADTDFMRFSGVNWFNPLD